VGHAIDSQELVGLLLDVSVKATVFALMVEVGLRSLRVKDAALSHSMWLGVAGGMMLFPALHFYLPTVSIPVIPAGVHVGSVLAGVDPAVGSALLALYAAGLGILLVRLLVGVVLGSRLVASSAPVADAAWRAFCRDHVGASWWRKAPQLRVSPLVRVPMTIGLLRPAIVLPAEWQAWSTLKTKSVLAHELAHVRRGDFVWQFVGELNLCLFWFHPVAWLLRHRISLAAERACDDSAILTVGDHCAYARHLVDIASAMQGGRGRVVALALPMAKRCQMRSRIDAILDRDRKLSRQLGRGGAVFVVMLACSVWTSAAAVCWERRVAGSVRDAARSCATGEAPCTTPCPGD
jgi:beta-lactamase regulating signal transducer with metallopeptidase domain